LIKDLCSLERKPFTCNNTYYDHIKGCWRDELSRWYENENIQLQAAVPNIRGARPRFPDVQEAGPAMATTGSALIRRQPSGGIGLVQGGQLRQFNEELEIMAGVLAYFEISAIRMIDHTVMTIREKLVENFATELESSLATGLGLEGKEGEYFAEIYGVDTEEHTRRYAELADRSAMLSNVLDELRKFERQRCDY
jgi:hypothetical protein